MNEDLKPCYDIGSNWEVYANAKAFGKLVHHHKDCKSLYRIIDYNNETISFHDTKRVLETGIIDIYRPLSSEIKRNLLGLILRIIHEVKPIKMPYVHEELKVYIEYHEGAVGLLYFKDSDEEKSIVPILRFFKISRDPGLDFEEITREEFSKIAEAEDEG